MASKEVEQQVTLVVVSRIDIVTRSGCDAEL
jgi:hypothetical protein